jgi:hypothetical protein
MFQEEDVEPLVCIDSGTRSSESIGLSASM